MKTYTEALEAKVREGALLVASAALLPCVDAEARVRASRYAREVRALLDKADWKQSQRRFAAEPVAPTGWGGIPT